MTTPIDDIARIYARGIAEHVRAGYVIDDMLLQNSIHYLRFKQAIADHLLGLPALEDNYASSDGNSIIRHVRKEIAEALGVKHDHTD